jgi:hypothetical protein
MEMEFAGEFETHITVSIQASSEIERLRQWGLDRDLKFLHIVLDRGVSISQPMVTQRGCGNLTSELAIARDLAIDLNAAGFSVVRIKIEAAPGNQDIPQSDRAALNHGRDRYFEHHLKLLLEPGFNDFQLLRELVERHSAHLSRNALQIRRDNYQERFITQRCVAIGQIEARKQLQILSTAIATLGYTVLSIVEEFVVYDSNLALDLGWMKMN